MSQLPALRSLGLGDGAWSVFYGLATAGARAGLGPLGAAILREQDTQGWDALLAGLRNAGTELDPGLAAAGVASASAEIRTATYWHLAIDLDDKPHAPEVLSTALAAAPEGRAGGAAGPEAALAYELLQRRLGKPRHPVLETLKSLEPELARHIPFAVLAAGDLIAVLDKPERKEISKAFFGRDDGLDKPRIGSRRRPPRSGGSYSVVETVGGFPPGYVPDVMQAVGCVLEGSDAILGGEVS